MNSIRALLALVLLLVAGPALAQARWSVSETSGTVTLHDANGARAATRGAAIPEGTAIETGGNGRAVIVRGRDFVTLSPGTRMRIVVPDREQAGLFQVLQDWGNAVFQIERRPNPHFGVRTPYLAAVVKGTTFSITVNADGASMQVIEGLVEAQTADGGARDLVPAGVVAMVAATDIDRLTVHGETTKDIVSPAAQGGATAPVAPYMPGTQPSQIAVRIESAPIELSVLTDGLLHGQTGDMIAEAIAFTTDRNANSPAPAPAPPLDAPALDNEVPSPPLFPVEPAVELPEPDAQAPPAEPAVETPELEAPSTESPADEPLAEPWPAGDLPHDDGNNGHGNDDDGIDEGNPGQVGDVSEDDGNNGHGNDDDGIDEGNPGQGGDVSEDDGNNGHGNDDDGIDEGNPGQGGGESEDDGNNGHGNDDDGMDDGNPGQGPGADDSDDGADGGGFGIGIGIGTGIGIGIGIDDGGVDVDIGDDDDDGRDDEDDDDDRDGDDDDRDDDSDDD